MGPTTTRPWDVTERLDSHERIQAYLDAALEEGGAALVAEVLCDIARARGGSEPSGVKGEGGKP